MKPLCLDNPSALFPAGFKAMVASRTGAFERHRT